MDTTTIIIYAAIGIGISLAITYYIIQGATKSKDILAEAKSQTEILKLIAVAHGVEVGKVEDITSGKHFKRLEAKKDLDSGSMNQKEYEERIEKINNGTV